MLASAAMFISSRSVVLAACCVLAACGDDTETSAAVEIACGAETCTECCNAEACGAGDACEEGLNEFQRLILYCDGPSDCAEGERCCADSGNNGAIVAECRADAECRELRAPTVYCNAAADCASGECTAVFEAEYVSTCRGSACVSGESIACECADGSAGTKVCYEEEYLPCRGSDNAVCE